MPSEHESLREELGALKPHTKDRLPLGDLLSEAEMDAIIEVIKQHDQYVIGDDQEPALSIGGVVAYTDAGKYKNHLRAEQRKRAKASYGTDKEEV